MAGGGRGRRPAGAAQDGAGSAALAGSLRLSGRGGGGGGGVHAPVRPAAAGPCAMEGGELGVENMESLTELGDELTLGDIDGGRRGKGGGGGKAARVGSPTRGGGLSCLPACPRGSGAADAARGGEGG